MADTNNVSKSGRKIWRWVIIAAVFIILFGYMFYYPAQQHSHSMSALALSTFA